MRDYKPEEWIHSGFDDIVLRSPSQGGAWYPHWRSIIAANLVMGARQAERNNIPWMFPANENDRHIADLFQATYYGPESCASADVFWAVMTYRANSRRGHGSRIRAMSIAGLTPAQIAPYVEGTESSVMTYLAYFFDVSGVFNNRTYMSSIVFPFQAGEYDGLDEETKRDRFWQAVAFIRGWTGLEPLLNKPMNTDKGALEEQINMAKALFTTQMLEYAFNARSFGMPRPVDFERWTEFQNTQNIADANAAQANNGQGQLYATMLMGLLGDQAAKGLLPKDKADEFSRIGKGSVIDVEAEVVATPMPFALPAAHSSIGSNLLNTLGPEFQKEQSGRLSDDSLLSLPSSI